jgi:hypothetical protein
MLTCKTNRKSKAFPSGVLLFCLIIFMDSAESKAQGVCTVERCTELGTCYINNKPSRCAYESHGASSGALVFPHGAFYLEMNLRNVPWGSNWSVIYGKRREFRTQGTNKLIGNWNYLSLDDGVRVRYPKLTVQH